MRYDQKDMEQKIIAPHWNISIKMSQTKKQTCLHRMSPSKTKTSKYIKQMEEKINFQLKNMDCYNQPFSLTKLKESLAKIQNKIVCLDEI